MDDVEFASLEKADEIMKVLDRYGLVLVRKNDAGRYTAVSVTPGTKAHRVLTRVLDKCLGVLGDGLVVDNLPGVTCCFGATPSEALFALAGEVRVGKARRI